MATAEEKRALLQRFRSGLPGFAENCLKVKTKDSKLLPFEFNAAQRYLHRLLEEQLEQTGKVRAIILKGRQMGCSTYVAARFYWRSTLWPYRNVFILAHEQGASDNLFEIVERYQAHNPVAPATGADNAKELEFSRIDSRYTVAVAGHKAGGRSRSTHLFHGSECAWWTNPDGHFAASVETVADMPGSEIILETTANGIDNRFYDEWQKAVAGESDYLAIFMPWFWMPEYRRPVPEGFRVETERPDAHTPSEAELIEMFGLDMEQLAWRRNKIASPGFSVALFNQEYPMTAEMAFIHSNTMSLISPLTVLQARKREIEPTGPLMIGVDPAGEGTDRFAVCGRRGHAVQFMESRRGVSTNEALAWIKALVDDHEPARVFIDAGGMGSAIISAARDMGDRYARVIRAVNFGGKSQSKLARPRMPGPKNRRSEMWQRMRDWLMLEEGVDVPDDEALQHDLCSVQVKATTTNDLMLESKDEMRRRGVKSPDLGDALALTFADLLYLDSPDYSDSLDKPANKSHTEEVAKEYPVLTSPNGWMV